MQQAWTLFLYYLHTPVGSGAIAGALAAAHVDYLAFRGFKTLREFAAYNWSTAIFRWAQGAAIGAVGASSWAYAIS